mmetsp:Transcript_171045/g.548117  ORF Transcript_171045/g.548117 Transcript_171045/m.548117 type:complete len:209 (-) Transcript_171045:722-1348(-)
MRTPMNDRCGREAYRCCQSPVPVFAKRPSQIAKQLAIRIDRRAVQRAHLEEACLNAAVLRWTRCPRVGRQQGTQAICIGAAAFLPQLRQQPLDCHEVPGTNGRPRQCSDGRCTRPPLELPHDTHNAVGALHVFSMHEGSEQRHQSSIRRLHVGLQSLPEPTFSSHRFCFRGASCRPSAYNWLICRSTCAQTLFLHSVQPLLGSDSIST